jgi:hypothetical protein
MMQVQATRGRKGTFVTANVTQQEAVNFFTSPLVIAAISKTSHLSESHSNHSMRRWFILNFQGFSDVLGSAAKLAHKTFKLISRYVQRDCPVLDLMLFF